MSSVENTTDTILLGLRRRMSDMYTDSIIPD
jgi:hypothetical protein